MAGRLDGKAALISGAAQGIGLAIAQAYALEGARVYGLDINANTLNDAFSRLSHETPQTVAWAECDVTDEVAVRRAIGLAQSQLGYIDTLVCNAATLTPSVKVEDLSAEDWNRALSVNLTSAFLLSKYAVPCIRTAGGGSIVIVASQMGSVAWKGSSAYCATKGALLQFAKALALDHVDDQIRANTLSPGGTLTQRLVTKFGSAQTAESEWGPMHPMGRLGQVDEIANGAVFLASDESSFMTGADLLMDGGYSAW